ncbi:DEKNAAC104637 [Brettanomyces naardenensis]|uniref:DEKNAAC104637 n=1 Tax=Brettanomyces naardenensis TaxID=13370 RepID=A0A448YRB2_BRENA|nr:DEKNAAC104637 [Brettanomyces naardenensis]
MVQSIQFVPSSIGWGILVGVGAAFALIMIVVSWLLTHYENEVQDSEMLSTARRSVKTGLVASAVVSSWTIGSTLLLSCTVTYELGISGAWWYGAGACVQIIIFAVAAIELKRKAPNAHTFQEIVRVRFGKGAHLTMCLYSFLQQLFYTANLLVNGSSVFSQMAGINREACCVLMPLFVVLYTLIGGIKATFLTDWVHVVIIFVVTLMFLFKVYVTSPYIGSPGKMWELLVEAGNMYPVAGNLDGSLVTFTSVSGGLFGLILFGTGWAAAVDSQLFQKAIAANPAGALAGYTLGGLSWFTLPYALATTMGLACRALEITPHFPTYPDRLSAEQLSAGLVLPISAYTIAGEGGTCAILLMVFLACTAAFSSETVAVSSLWTYDIYKAYINPEAKGKKLVFMTHLGVICFSIASIVLAIGLGRANFDVSFITTCCGIVVNVVVIPMGCTLFWKKMSPLAMTITPYISSGISIGVWMGYTKYQSGEITMASLSTYQALAAGNTVAIGVSGIIAPIIVWFKPSNFDWNVWKENIKQDDNKEFDEKRGLTNVLSGDEETYIVLEDEQLKDKEMIRKRNIGIAMTIVFVLFFLVLFPIPLYATNYIFTKKFFRGYIIVTFLWVFFSVGVVTIYPAAEGIPTAIDLFKRIIKNEPRIKMNTDEVVEHVTTVTSRKQVGKEKNTVLVTTVSDTE